MLSELDAAAVQPFARGQGVFLVHVDSAADLRRIIHFQRDNPSLDVAISGGAEAWQVADELAAARIPVIVDPLANLPDAFERLSARLDNAALLQAAGVQIAIAPAPGTAVKERTVSPSGSRKLSSCGSISGLGRLSEPAPAAPSMISGPRILLTVCRSGANTWVSLTSKKSSCFALT